MWRQYVGKRYEGVKLPFITFAQAKIHYERYEFYRFEQLVLAEDASIVERYQACVGKLRGLTHTSTYLQDELGVKHGENPDPTWAHIESEILMKWWQVPEWTSLIETQKMARNFEATRQTAILVEGLARRQQLEDARPLGTLCLHAGSNKSWLKPPRGWEDFNPALQPRHLDRCSEATLVRFEPVFTKLKKLRIDVGWQVDDPQVIVRSGTVLFGNMPYLVDLRLNLRGHGSCIDTPSPNEPDIFSHVPKVHWPNLVRLHLSASSSEAGLRTFLARHATTIEDLTLTHFSIIAGQGSWDGLLRTFPTFERLKYLSLCSLLDDRTGEVNYNGVSAYFRPHNWEPRGRNFMTKYILGGSQGKFPPLRLDHSYSDSDSQNSLDDR